MGGEREAISAHLDRTGTMVLLISYDLVGHARPARYAKVKEYIERHSQSYVRPLYSQWLIETQASPDAWVAGLQNNNLIDRNDRLFVGVITRPYQGRLVNSDWAWLNPRV